MTVVLLGGLFFFLVFSQHLFCEQNISWCVVNSCQIFTSFNKFCMFCFYFPSTFPNEPERACGEYSSSFPLKVLFVMCHCVTSHGDSNTVLIYVRYSRYLPSSESPCLRGRDFNSGLFRPHPTFHLQDYTACPFKLLHVLL